MVFALLDNTPPISAPGQVGCQPPGVIEIPTGYRIAPDIPIVKAALAHYRWGTDCIALATNRSYTCNLKLCSTGAMFKNLPCTDNDCFGVLQCNSRILLVSAENITDTFNLVSNGGFFSSNSKDITDWLPYAAGPLEYSDCSRIYDFSGSGCITLNDNTSDFGSFNLHTWTDAEAAAVAGIYFSGWSRSSSLASGNSSFRYSLYLDIKFTDGTFLYGTFVPFTMGSHDWEFVDTIAFIPQGKIIAETRLYARFGGATGRVCFDDISMYALASTCSGSGSGSTTGDPHIRSCDGRKYDLQTVREYTLYQDSDVNAQIRQERLADDATINTAIALQYDQTTIQFTTATGTTLPYFYINKQSASITSNYYIVPGSSISISTTGDSLAYNSPIMYTITFPTNLGVIVQVFVGDYAVQWFEVHFNVPAYYYGHTAGLLGNCNGDKSDDFTTSSGTVLDSTATEHDIYFTFAESWKISSTSSLFVYDQGKSTDYYNTQDIAVPPGLDSFPENSVAKATEVCVNSGVSANDLTDCIYDYLHSTDNSFATSSTLSFGKSKATGLSAPNTTTSTPRSGSFAITASVVVIIVAVAFTLL
jgi:hypothetical protein